MSRLFPFLLLSSLLSACSQAMPTCQLQDANSANHQTEIKGNAGCWIVEEGKLLLVKQRNGLFSYPGGTAQSGESAQCTAHRETWEEAGIAVSVGTLKHRFENGFYLFHCHLQQMTRNTNDTIEIVAVLWTDPLAIPEEQWRFPAQRALSARWLQRNNN